MHRPDSDDSDILVPGADRGSGFAPLDQQFGGDSDFATWPEFMVGQSDRPVKVMVVDDDAHIRQVIARELLGDVRIDLVAQASSLKEGRRKIAQHDIDVLLVDLNLGDGSGYELIQTIKALQPRCEAVVISAIEDEKHAIQAFANGATGYLVKNSWFGSFPQAVLQVVNGGASITPNLARRLLQRLDTRGVPAPQPLQRERLSDREREILKMVAAGYTSVEIAERLAISAQTVNTHIRNIYRKLQVKTRAQAVTRAADQGLL